MNYLLYATKYSRNQYVSIFTNYLLKILTILPILGNIKFDFSYLKFSNNLCIFD